MANQNERDRWLASKARALALLENPGLEGRRQRAIASRKRAEKLLKRLNEEQRQRDLVKKRAQESTARAYEVLASGKRRERLSELTARLLRAPEHERRAILDEVGQIGIPHRWEQGQGTWRGYKPKKWGEK